MRDKCRACGARCARWQYTPPAGVTRPWAPRLMRACDGTHASMLIQLPLLGHIVYFRNTPCGHNDKEN